MKKYYYIILGVMNEYMAYRLNFILWRFRMMIQLLVVFVLWNAIYQSNTTLFGYSQSQMLTYILLSAIIKSIVLSTTTQQIGVMINNGSLTNYLLRPLHIMKAFITRDISDKLLNSSFAIVEIIMLYLMFYPPVFIQTDGFVLFMSFISLGMAIMIYFLYSMFFSLLGFWTADIWALRFISFIILEFFGGSLYPLDILPKPLFWISQILPFSYCIYTPIRIYIGGLSYREIIQTLCISGIWVMLLWFAVMVAWKKGLKRYTAEGR